MSTLGKVKLSKNFSLDEFVKTSTGLENIPDEKVIENLRALTTNILQPLRDHFNLPLHINSGYRSPIVNSAIGGADTSQHLTGEAADIHIQGKTNQEIIDAIYKLGLPFDQLIDEQLHGSKWVHVSFSKRKNRRQWLTARDGANGKTIYSTIKQG